MGVILHNKLPIKGKIKKKTTTDKPTFYQYQFISLELVPQSPRHSNLQRRCSTVGCLPPTSCVLCPNQPPIYHLDKMGSIYGKCTKDSLPSFKRGLGIRWIGQESTVFQVNEVERWTLLKVARIVSRSSKTFRTLGSFGAEYVVLSWIPTCNLIIEFSYQKVVEHPCSINDVWFSDIDKFVST